MGRRLEEVIEDQRETQTIEEFTQELYSLMIKDIRLENGEPIPKTQRKLCIIEAVERTYEAMGGSKL